MTADSQSMRTSRPDELRPTVDVARHGGWSGRTVARRRLFDVVLDQMGDGIIIADAAGRLRWVNPATRWRVAATPPNPPPSTRMLRGSSRPPTCPGRRVDARSRPQEKDPSYSTSLPAVETSRIRAAISSGIGGIASRWMRPGPVVEAGEVEVYTDMRDTGLDRLQCAHSREKAVLVAHYPGVLGHDVWDRPLQSANILGPVGGE